MVGEGVAIAIARDRDGSVDWIVDDALEFVAADPFDVVICMYDTVNHFNELADWRRLFRRAHDLLREGGLFLFDVNTVSRLRQLGDGPPWVHDFASNVLIVDITCETRGDLASSTWDIRIFANEGEETFRLHSATVHETAAPLDLIRQEVQPLFDVLELTNEQGLTATEDSRRAYFALRRR